ncbi:MAG TPA: aldehyde dehydrogenase family protein, partial [Novosphingobium sp.]|nr:aldehyde dehydrogenase family protein [Novosphingobium sp.]
MLATAMPMIEQEKSMDAARSAIDRIAARPGHFVDGAWMAPATGETLTVEDPSTTQAIGCIAQGDARDIDAAVAAASAAMARRAWSATQRQDALLALAAAIETEAETFAGLECL